VKSTAPHPSFGGPPHRRRGGARRSGVYGRNAGCLRRAQTSPSTSAATSSTEVFAGRHPENLQGDEWGAGEIIPGNIVGLANTRCSSPSTPRRFPSHLPARAESISGNDTRVHDPQQIVFAYSRGRTRWQVRDLHEASVGGPVRGRSMRAHRRDLIILACCSNYIEQKRLGPRPHAAGRVLTERASEGGDHEGDTVDIAGTRIRLEGIDAPERHRPETD